MFAMAALYASVEGLSSTKATFLHQGGGGTTETHTHKAPRVQLSGSWTSFVPPFCPSTTAYAFRARGCSTYSRQLPRKDPQKSRHQCCLSIRPSHRRREAKAIDGGNQNQHHKQNRFQQQHRA